MRISKVLPLLVMLFLLLVVFTDSSFAEISKDTVTLINDQFKTKAETYGIVFQKYALKTFYWLLMFDIAYMGAMAVLNRAEIVETLANFARLLLFAGFCYAVIIHYHEWSGQIIKGLGSYAKEATGVDLTLSPLKIGFDIVDIVLTKVSAWQPIDSLGYIIAGGVILVVFAMMTARILIIKCEAYIAMNAAILLLGFGGTSLLKDYAINAMRYTLSVAFKLFTMQLVMGVGISFIREMKVGVSTEWTDLFVLLACAAILLAIVNSIPETVAGIINGSHTGSGVGFKATFGAAVGAAVGGAVGAATGSKNVLGTVSDAVKKASLEGHEGLGNVAKAAAGNLKDAYGSARQSKNAMGSVGQRMSAHMKESRTVAEKAAEEGPVQGSGS